MRGAGAAGLLDEVVGHRPQGALAVDVLERDRGERPAPRARRDEAGGEQRVAAEIGEEVGGKRDRLVAEDALCRDEERRLGLVCRLLLLAGRVADGELGHLERLAVDLAGGQPRQGLDDLEMARDHVGRELVAQIRPDRRPVEGDARLEHQEGDEAVHALVLAQHHGRLRDARQVHELRLDLAELDPEAADLDLVVDAAVEGDVARLVEADGIAGAVQDRVAAVGREGIGDELLGRQLRALEVALGDAGTADEKLALNARRQEIEALVDHIGAVVRDRPPDRHGLAGAQLAGGRDDRRLGRAVGVEEPPAGLRPAGDERRRQRLAAEEDQPHAGDVAVEEPEQRRHRVEHGDAGRDEDVGQLLGVADRRRARDDERRADHVGDPDLLHRQVEGDGGALEHDVVGGEAVERVRGAQEVADIAMGDDDALRRAGRARGVDEIGRVVGGQPAGLRIDRRAAARPGELVRGQDRAADLRLGNERRARHKPLCAGIGKADRDAVDRRVGIERQPGGAGLRDRDLGDQELGAAAHPQPDDVARADAALDQPAGNGIAARVDLAIAVARLAEDEGGMVGAGARRRGEEVGQDLVADEIVADVAPQDGGFSGRLDPETRTLGRLVHPMLRARGGRLPCRLADARTAATPRRRSLSPCSSPSTAKVRDRSGRRPHPLPKRGRRPVSSMPAEALNRP